MKPAIQNAVRLGDQLAAELPEVEREAFKRGFIQGWLHRGRMDDNRRRSNKKMANIKA
jgi:hypothetical protein